jgi:hypothetical protein
MALSERGDAVVVGVLVSREHAEGDIVMRRPLDPPRRRLSHAVRIDEKLEHQHS